MRRQLSGRASTKAKPTTFVLNAVNRYSTKDQPTSSNKPPRLCSAWLESGGRFYRCNNVRSVGVLSTDLTSFTARSIRRGQRSASIRYLQTRDRTSEREVHYTCLLVKGTTQPVINRPASEQRKAMLSAMSCGETLVLFCQDAP
jgi:hypothetical protein